MVAILSAIAFLVCVTCDSAGGFAYSKTSHFKAQMNGGGGSLGSSADYSGTVYDTEEEAQFILIEKVFSGIASVAAVVFIILLIKMRYALREKHDLEGGVIADCCLSLFC